MIETIMGIGIMGMMLYICEKLAIINREGAEHTVLLKRIADWMESE